MTTIANNPAEYWMAKALELAQRAANLGEVPVGALIVMDNQVIGEGFNQPITSQDPTAHAEIVALRCAARALGNYRLVKADLYVTIEPCTMCVGAMIHARIQRVFFGALETKAGALESHQHILGADCYNHQISYQGGILEEPCRRLMQDFFAARRKKTKSSNQPN